MRNAILCFLRKKITADESFRCRASWSYYDRCRYAIISSSVIQLHPASYLAMVIYINRLENLSLGGRMAWDNALAFCAVAFLLASKFWEDRVFSLDIYARLFGLSKRQLAELEFHALRALEFNLCISCVEFERECTSLGLVNSVFGLAKINRPSTLYSEKKDNL